MSTEHTDTPETDAIMETLAICFEPETDYEHFKAAEESVRCGVENLERERNEARKEAARLLPIAYETRPSLDSSGKGVTWAEAQNNALEALYKVQDERDQLRARVAELEKLLQRWLPFGEFNAPAPSHDGSCGFGDCDAGCMQAASASLLIQETRQAIDAAKGHQ